MQNTLIFALTNLVQLSIVFNVIIPPVECAMTCFVSLMSGMTLIPTFIVMNGIAMTAQPFKGDIKSLSHFITRLAAILFVTLFPLASGYIALWSYNECPDSNSHIWFIQGLTVPASIWSICQIFHGTCQPKQIESIELQVIHTGDSQALIQTISDDPPTYDSLA